MTLKPPSVSGASRVLDVTEMSLFSTFGGDQLDTGDRCECFSLNDLVLHVKSKFKDATSPPPALETKTYNECLAQWVLETILNHNRHDKLKLVVNQEVKGLRDIPDLYYSSCQRYDVTVYDREAKKVLLQVEVQSSMRQAVNKAIYGAADMIRFLRYSIVDFKKFVVFALPKAKEEGRDAKKRSAVKITIEWKDLRFYYQLQTISSVQDLCKEIEAIVGENERSIPVLPDRETVKSLPPYLVRLSEEELGIFGSNAKQCPSHFHVMIEVEDYMYKLVHESKETVVLLHLGRITDRQAVRHFIVPEFCQPHLFECLVKYSKLPYGLLDRLQAGKLLKTFVEKVDLALTELHNMGIAHSDVRLPNICFNHQYDAVLIDMERCCDAKKFPHIAVRLPSCMYTQPKNVDFFSGECMDYMQLGWLVAWVLSDKDENGKSDYHDRSWSTQIMDIRNDMFVKKLVCCGEYSRSDLDDSVIVVDNTGDLFSTLFLS